MPPRVLITRSPHQASSLAEALRALGAETLLVPTIELAEPTSFELLDHALMELQRYNWLLFTSANAVEAFDHRRMKLWNSSVCGDVAGNRPYNVAVIGPATARMAEALGLRADLQPEKAVAESLVESLLPFALQDDGSATRFLLVRAEHARDVLPEMLQAAGAEVTIAPAYRTVIPQASLSQVQRLFSAKERYPDAVTFTSSSTATNLFALLAEAGMTLPEEVLRISIGPITSRTLREHGLPPHAEATEATVVSLAARVAEMFGLADEART